ncbi:MAG: QueT transporter family protein [Sporolactobacillus sp.]
MKLKWLAINAIVAALYIVLTYLIQPIGFYAIQLRLSEMLNQLIVFDRKYIYGICGGVFLANLLFSPMLPFDLTFGFGQSVISLLLTIVLTHRLHSVWLKMSVNALIFASSMSIIAWELSLAGVAGHVPFWFNWLSVATGELVVMGIAMPLVYAINKRMNLSKQF